MVCPYCHRKMIWGGDHSYEDYGIDIDEGDGIVSNSTCVNNECDVETVIIYSKV